MNSSLQKTSLYQAHKDSGAKLVPFYGWWMPLHYGSQILEHEQVRKDAGLFDVSHMTILDILGVDRKQFLHKILANDINKLRIVGQAQYTTMLNEQGGIIDDLIVYFMEDRYRLVVNCGTREKVLSWLEKQQNMDQITITERTDLTMLAVQGPNARSKVAQVLGDEAQTVINELLPFTSEAQAHWQIARTGYTGEDGLEIMLPATQAPTLWEKLINSGITPCGLGARDTLRLEAGLNLYGQDMDETTTPFESHLGWTVALETERYFIGQEALKKQKEAGHYPKLIGLIYEGKGVLRSGYAVINPENLSNMGVITSGSYSPTLKKSIALARINTHNQTTTPDTFNVDLRGRLVQVQKTQLPFLKKDHD